MKFKKFLRPFWSKSNPVEQLVNQRRRFGFLHWGSGLQKIGLLHWLIPALVTVGVVATVVTQVPSLRLAGFQFSKPRPIVASSTTLPADIQQAIEVLANQQIKQELANATLPVNLSKGSLNQTNVGFLEELFATNPADERSSSLSKAKVRIKKIDGRIKQLQILLTKDKSDKAISEAVKLIQEIGKETDKVATDPKVVTDREVLGLVIEQYNRLQLILQQVEDTLPINDYLKIEDARKKYLVVTATNSINAAPNLDAVHNIAIKEVAKVVGDEFAELKAIEIISDFEADVKPEAKEKLIGLEKELAINFEKKMLKLPRDVRNKKLQDYIQYSFGDPLLQVHILNNIQGALSDREVILGVGSLKELAMKKLIDRIFELKTQEEIDKFLQGVIQSPDDLKVLGEMQLAVNSGRDEERKQKLAQMTKSVEGKVTQFFASGNLDSYFAPQPGKPTDILDVLLVSNLQAIVSATPQAPNELKQKFTDLKNKTRKAFVAEISSKDFVTKSTLAYNPVSSNADVRVLLSSPQALGLLQKIKSEATPSEKSKIDIAIKAQSAILQEHILVQIQDPEIFEDYQSFINQNPRVKQTLQTYASQKFFINLSKKSETVQKVALEDKQKLYEVMQQIVQAIFLNNNETDLEKKLPSNIAGQITRLKKTLPAKNIPQMAVPDGVNLPKVAKLSDSIEQTIIQAAKQRIKNKQISEEVKLDLTVQAKDLGIREPRILPDSPFYAVKKFMRTIQLVLAFDPLQRAQALINQDNEKTLEAAMLLEKSSSRKTIDLALATLAEVEKDFAKLKENSAKLDKLRQTQPKKIDEMVDQIIRNGLARQTVFSSIENKVFGRDYVRVEKIRQNVLKDGIESLLQLAGGDAQKLAQKLELAVSIGSGSKFKELKAIELLTEIKRFQPEKIGQVLEASEIRLVKQFETHLLSIEKNQRERELLAYADSIPGNPIRQFEAYEQLKDSFENPQTLLLVEALKDKAVENLRDVVSEISDGETLQEFVTDVVGDKPEDLKIITEIELRVGTPNLIGEVQTSIEEKIEEIKAEVEQNVIDNIISDPTSLTESDLISGPSSQGNTSIADVEVIHELEQILENSAEVAPEIIETVHQVEGQVIADFVETVTQSPAQALEPVPQVIETLVELKEEQPASVDATIDLAIQTEVGIIQDYLETQVDSPETLETYLAQIEESPVVSQVISEVGGSEFNQILEQTVSEVSQTATQEETLLEEIVAQVEQEIFSGTASGETLIETLPQSVQEEIQQVKEDVPVGQITPIEVTIETQTSTEIQPITTPEPVPAPTTEVVPVQETQSAPVPEAPAPATEPAPAPVEEPQAPTVPGL